MDEALNKTFKVMVQYILSGRELGRTAWIVKAQNGELAIGTIYCDEASATPITQNELNYLKSPIFQDSLAVVKVI